ncbi:hypothetical protein POTOM_035629 [Populus tomentosa]|uniref:AWPM-19-like family protein n=1 Tax=Populus tomentosa TaxID=118781 RepID=A0A8X7YY52_POPTO|nr:hypothetical protein POTOM_035629 [Populus tomentosa]
MAQTVGRNIAAPLLFLNLLMYAIALGFASWCTNRYINGQTSHPSVLAVALIFASLHCFLGGYGVNSSFVWLIKIKLPGFGGNGATGFFLTFAILACVVGMVSKFVGGAHVRAWRGDSLAAAGSASLIAWAITALAFGFACKEINVGGYRGWRLRAVEAFIIILTFTQLLYVLLLHAGMFSSRYGPGYRDTDYGVGAGTGEPIHKGGAVPVAGARV